MKELGLLSSLAEFDRSEEFIYLARGRGGFIPQFKVLFTNYCERNCLYCANRRDRDTPRYSFTPEELAKTFLNLYQRGKVKGLFLSSGIHHNALRTMERMISAVEIIRRNGFNDFIHLKILPGTDDSTIERAVEVADRVSVNLEAVSPQFLKMIAREKDYSSLMRKLYFAHRIRRMKNKRVGIATQIIVGGAGERDRDILNFAKRLIRDIDIQMVYFSAFQPVKDTPMENHPPENRKREMKLYKAFFLMKDYGVEPELFVFDKNHNLIYDDPKEGILIKMGVRVPLEVNTAPYEILKLVPGIGIKTARKIVIARRNGNIKDPHTLISMGAKKTSLNYLLINGRFYGTEKGFTLFKM